MDKEEIKSFLKKYCNDENKLNIKIDRLNKYFQQETIQKTNDFLYTAILKIILLCFDENDEFDTNTLIKYIEKYCIEFKAGVKKGNLRLADKCFNQCNDTGCIKKNNHFEFDIKKYNSNPHFFIKTENGFKIISEYNGPIIEKHKGIPGKIVGYWKDGKIILIKDINIENSLLEKFALFFDKNKEKELENLRKSFVQKFPLDKIYELSLEDYVVGMQNENSFCNFLETRLKDLGDIHGSNAIKFGVYFGKQGNDNIKKYRFAKKYGAKLEESFSNIKLEIIKLIKNGENEDLSNIQKCKLSSLFRGKILTTYFPEKYINIFSEEHLDYFLTKLNIGNLTSLNILEKQQNLLNIKNNNLITNDWSNYKFSCFLYETFGKPSKNQDTIEKYEDFSLNEQLNDDILNYPIDNCIYQGAKERQEPMISNGCVVYPREKKVSINALALANFQCEIDKSHPSFLRKNGKNYTEPHHLIPMKYQKDFEKRLDIPENIISLCSNCHNQIHYGKDSDSLIKILYEQRKELLKEAKIEVTLEQLLKMYK